ncbi:MAG: hypothetical protein M1484_02205 [Patescibacteria group bacterium]|nr:hypothetical protein [Patescibacteria group bacterium]
MSARLSFTNTLKRGLVVSEQELLEPNEARNREPIIGAVEVATRLNEMSVTARGLEQGELRDHLISVIRLGDGCLKEFLGSEREVGVFKEIVGLEC